MKAHPEPLTYYHGVPLVPPVDRLCYGTTVTYDYYEVSLVTVCAWGQPRGLRFGLFEGRVP